MLNAKKIGIIKSKKDIIKYINNYLKNNNIYIKSFVLQKIYTPNSNRGIFVKVTKIRNKRRSNLLLQFFFSFEQRNKGDIIQRK